MRLSTALLLCVLSSPASAIKIERFTGVLSDKPPIEVVAEQAFVRFSTGANRGGLSAIGARVVKEFDSIGWTLVELASGTRVADGIRRLQGVPGALEVEPNNVYRPNRTPNDAFVAQQYALGQINAFSAWEYELGTSNLATVAVIDSGIDQTHPDLTAKVLTAQSASFDPTTGADTTPTNDPLVPACSHGTNVAGIAAASTNNGTGMAGTSWGAKLLALKVFRNADCAGQFPSCDAAACATDNAGIIAAMNYAVTLQNSAATGRIIINMSLGGAGIGGNDAACPGAVQTAVTNAVNAGLVVVAAAGNDGQGVNTPASCAGVIPVGATDPGGSVANFSSRGPALAANGLVAPGVSVLTTTVSSGYSSPSGTSFSCPIVAGAAALLLSAKPLSTVAEVKSFLLGTANAQTGISSASLEPRPRNAVNGAGGLNMFKAVKLAVTGSAAFEGDSKAIAFPNPFRVASAGNVTFSIPTNIQGPQLRVRIYDQSGALVKEVTGTTWDGKNVNGVLVASGTYMFVISTTAGRTTGRFALIR